MPEEEKAKRLTSPQKKVIIKMKEAGHPQSVIADAVDGTVEQVKKFWQRYQTFKHMPPKVKVANLIIDAVMGREIKRLLAGAKNVSVRKLPGLLATKFPERKIPSEATIRNYLKQRTNLKFIKLLKKPLISQKNKKKRLAFAKEWTEGNVDHLRNVIWSDETMVRSNPLTSSESRYLPKSMPAMERPVQTRVQQGGISVMFWGCMSRLGFGPLIAIEGSMNQHEYIQMLEEQVVPEIRAANAILRQQRDGQMLFMQDNAPCHKTRAVMAFLESNDVSVIDWPPSSPDMNPIENLWALIKRRRGAECPVPTSRDELIEQIFKIWNSLDVSLAQKLCLSASRRLEAVKKSRGGPTKY